MASMINREFERAFEEAMNEIDKKIEKAFQRTMKRLEGELFEVMKDASVLNYYRGYFPHVYQRTNQLHKAINLRVDDASKGNILSLDVVPIYDETLPGADGKPMDHSVYKIKAKYEHVKNKKKTGKVSYYDCTVKLKDKHKPDEEKIMEMTLGAGYHPRVGTMFTEAPIWTEDDEGYLIDELERYMNDNFSKTFNEEYDKL